jgi:4a-hydroxytetrahydrobiopterin dehydratase
LSDPANELASQKCVDCLPGTPPLSADQAQELAGQIDPAWAQEGGGIAREFKLRNFNEAFGLATRIALLAEEQGHHPDLEVGWGRVKVFLTTHSAGGLTKNDFVVAAKIDKIAG